MLNISGFHLNCLSIPGSQMFEIKWLLREDSTERSNKRDGNINKARTEVLFSNIENSMRECYSLGLVHDYCISKSESKLGL